MRKYWILLFVFLLGLIWSGIMPYNQWIWFVEIFPNIVGLTILIITFNRFRFTYFTYIIILFTCLFIFIGAHYTYAKVPLGYDFGKLIGVERNNFDKLGHFIQGAVPIFIAREFFLRRKIVSRKWIGFVAFCICMTSSAIYEIIEYIACVIAQKPADDFLGTQGFYWDSQSDMLAALIGGIFVVFIFQKIHNQIIEKEFPRELN